MVRHMDAVIIATMKTMIELCGQNSMEKQVFNELTHRGNLPQGMLFSSPTVR